MNRDVQDTTLALVGGTVLAVGISDVHLRYVKPGMQWLLIVAGALLLVIGLRDVSRRREGEPEHPAPRTAWLLMLPVLVMALVTPGALGSFSADRSPSRPPPLTDGFPALRADRDGAVDLSLSSFTARVAYAQNSLAGRRVRLVGFVSPQDQGWAITRVQLSCCAADGRPIRVRALGDRAQAAPERDTWVEVVGTAGALQGGDGGEVTAGLEIEQMTAVDAPARPYE